MLSNLLFIFSLNYLNNNNIKDRSSSCHLHIFIIYFNLINYLNNYWIEVIIYCIFPGQTADYAIVFANLISSDGLNHGLHPFIVPIRDVKTKQAFPGLKVGDLGEKIGLNGVDNGWVMFNKYRIPKENLLSKTGSLDSNGKYVSSIKDPKKRMGKYIYIRV